jgi:Protein of unknown function (DUF1036)
MGLSFRNDTPDGLYLAYLRWDPSCPGAGDPGQPFSGHGWYRIEAGQTREVCSGDVGDWHRWWGYFARSDSGRFWAGQYGMSVPTQPFSQCYSSGVTTSEPGASTQIGFRGLLMDDDYDDFLQPLIY